MTEFSPEDLSAPMGLEGIRTGMFAEGEFNGWHGIKSRLTKFAQLPNAYQLLESVFDIQDQKAARVTLNEWREGVFSHLPTVSVLTDVEMQGALGGYSADRRSIYIAESIACIDSITGKVLAEEFGHHLDNHFNSAIDTGGDEGNLFSRILFGIEIANTDLDNLMSEDDRGFIVSNHQQILVERSQVAIESMGGLLYQTQRGTDSKIYTRVSTDGKTWSAWSETGGVTNSAPSLAALNGTLYQVHRGVDNKIYTRSSTNGKTWTSWHEAGGVTESAPAVASLNDRLYQSHRGLDNKIYTRSTVNGTNWTNWQEAGGETNHAPALATFNGRLYQSIKGINNKIYTRSSTNGTSWTSWHEAGGITYSQPALEAANGRLYQSHRGTDNQIYTRSSTNGINWTNWHQAGGVTDFAPSIASHNGRLYQTHRGSDNLIYTRSSTDGTNWDSWSTGATTNSSSYRVVRLNSDGNEGHSHTFKIIRSGNISVAGQVRFATSSDTATSGSDFIAYSAVRNFAPDQDEQIVYVDSRTDNVNEGTERFNVSISKVNDADTITTASTFGQIFNVNQPAISNTAITVFEHANYSGRSKSFAVGDYSFVGSDFNDIATSIRVPFGQNLVVEVYEHANFKGRSTVLSYSQASIGADWGDPNWRTSYMNDSISSIRVRQQRSDEVILYQHSNYQGLAHSEETGSVRSVRFNDDYSSIDLPPNTRIDVFENAVFGGRMLSFVADVPFVGELNDKISSYQSYRVNTPEVVIAIYDRALVQFNDNRQRVSDAIAIYGAITGNKNLNAIANLIGLEPQKLIDQFKVNPVGGILTFASLLPLPISARLFIKFVGLYNAVVSSIVSPIVTLSLANLKKRNDILREIEGWK